MQKQSVPFLSHILFMLLIITVSGCSKNSLTAVDISPKAQALQGPIFIVGVFKNQTTHNIYEASLAEHFEKNGIKAVMSHEYGFSAGVEPEDDALKETMNKTGCKEVFFTHLLSQKVENDHVAAIGGYKVYAATWDNIHGYQALVYDRRFSPADNIKHTTDFMEAAIFDWKTGKKIWSARTKSKNLNTYLRKDDDQLEDLFIQSLKKNKLL